MQITSRVIGTSFATEGDFELTLAGGGQFSAAQTFANTGGVVLGDSAADVFDFNGGMTNVAGPTTVQGTLRATNQSLQLSDVVLLGNSTISSKSIRLGSVSGSSNLTLNGDVTLEGAGIFTSGNLTINGQLNLATDTALAFAGVTSVSQRILGTSQLVKSGSGTLKISDRSFAGRLSIKSGEVELLGGLSGIVTLGGGTLRASGTLDSGLDTDGNGGSLILGTTTTILQSADDVLLDDKTILLMDIKGATPGTGHDQLRVTGSDRFVELNDATLSLTLGFAPVVGSKITLIHLEDRTSTLNGRFADLDEDAVFKIGNQSFSISYIGGDGNDVVLTAIATSELDFGSAPDSYGTQLVDNGACHLAMGSPRARPGPNPMVYCLPNNFFAFSATSAASLPTPIRPNPHEHLGQMFYNGAMLAFDIDASHLFLSCENVISRHKAANR